MECLVVEPISMSPHMHALVPRLLKVPYGGYAGVSQSENVELTDRDKEIIQRLKDWDLWGPLIVCLALAVLLSFKAPVGT